MKKLDNLTHWYARVFVKSNKQDGAEIDEFPFDIGAITLTSEDGKRNFIIDPYETYGEDYDETYEFMSKCEVDKDTFPKGKDYNYNLTVEDLKTAKGVMYLPWDDEVVKEPRIEVTFYLPNDEQIDIICQNDVE